MSVFRPRRTNLRLVLKKEEGKARVEPDAKLHRRLEESETRLARRVSVERREPCFGCRMILQPSSVRRQGLHLTLVWLEDAVANIRLLVAEENRGGNITTTDGWANRIFPKPTIVCSDSNRTLWGNVWLEGGRRDFRISNSSQTPPRSSKPPEKQLIAINQSCTNERNIKARQQRKQRKQPSL